MEIQDIVTVKYPYGMALICSSGRTKECVTVELMTERHLIVSIDLWASPKLVRDGEMGLLYRADDPPLLADRIGKAMTGPGKERAIAARRQRRATTNLVFDGMKYDSSMTGLYKEIVHG